MEMATAFKARPTVYNGVRMRSRLEADYAAYLDRSHQEWEYEPECFASADGQWLPDFRVRYPSHLNVNPWVFVELKPAGMLDNHWQGIDDEGKPAESIDKILARMTIAWATDPNASLSLVYWNYRGSAELVIDCGGNGAPWLAQCARLPLLWTGMGQYNRCCAED